MENWLYLVMMCLTLRKKNSRMITLYINAGDTVQGHVQSNTEYGGSLKVKSGLLAINTGTQEQKRLRGWKVTLLTSLGATNEMDLGSGGPRRVLSDPDTIFRPQIQTFLDRETFENNVTAQM